MIKENFDVLDWSIPDNLLPNFAEIEQASGLLVSTPWHRLNSVGYLLNAFCAP
ncbi:unnamed protein product [Linum tenue]|uniref:Uncharacterized protein n=1 Tax=Linum tenue TaxID=586396 RepID=A0AAV0LAA3_9ROSI|nr:unnamed protein product [Linum tenue]